MFEDRQTFSSGVEKQRLALEVDSTSNPRICMRWPGKQHPDSTPDTLPTHSRHTPDTLPDPSSCLRLSCRDRRHLKLQRGRTISQACSSVLVPQDKGREELKCMAKVEVASSGMFSHSDQPGVPERGSWKEQVFKTAACREEKGARSSERLRDKETRE